MAYKRDRECPIPQAEAVGALGERAVGVAAPLVLGSTYLADAMYLSYLGIWPCTGTAHIIGAFCGVAGATPCPHSRSRGRPLSLTLSTAVG